MEIFKDNLVLLSGLYSVSIYFYDSLGLNSGGIFLAIPKIRFIFAFLFGESVNESLDGMHFRRGG